MGNLFLFILVVFLHSIRRHLSSNQRKDLSDSWCDNVSHDAWLTLQYRAARVRGAGLPKDNVIWGFVPRERLHPMFPSLPLPLSYASPFSDWALLPPRKLLQVSKSKDSCQHKLLHFLPCGGMLWILAARANFIKSFQIAWGAVAGSCEACWYVVSGKPSSPFLPLQWNDVVCSACYTGFYLTPWKPMTELKPILGSLCVSPPPQMVNNILLPLFLWFVITVRTISNYLM